eukprot:TRINITY_DN4753_c0_g1_i1.p1 TRINITY_DN4753_c0_g1~~TRINITY_DN4753_c0_g1_i1.p1  ORF type:complete len:194 (-),score=19.19 TRINITY_DN4753_c0_g1_i1:246-827(-)
MLRVVCGRTRLHRCQPVAVVAGGGGGAACTTTTATRCPAPAGWAFWPTTTLTTRTVQCVTHQTLPTRYFATQFPWPAVIDAARGKEKELDMAWKSAVEENTECASEAVYYAVLTSLSSKRGREKQVLHYFQTMKVFYCSPTDEAWKQRAHKSKLSCPFGLMAIKDTRVHTTDGPIQCSNISGWAFGPGVRSVR